jgi:hypothetical protein
MNNATPLACPICSEDHEVVRVEAPAAMSEGRLSCVKCGGPLHARERRDQTPGSSASAIRHSTETSNAPSNGSMIPVMKVRQCWQVNLQLTKPRLSKVALVDRRNSSCAPHFGHSTRRFCKSTFPASAAIAQSRQPGASGTLSERGGGDCQKAPSTLPTRRGNK